LQKCHFAGDGVVQRCALTDEGSYVRIIARMMVLNLVVVAVLCGLSGRRVAAILRYSAFPLLLTSFNKKCTPTLIFAAGASFLFSIYSCIILVVALLVSLDSLSHNWSFPPYFPPASSMALSALASAIAD
jgi:hypothetical protein